ncbi:ubiquitin-protein ligase (E3) [Elasticomyces elasticus]|nr:ubiquitin-protein ligase (E3) [Elasticomyces elasticus]KAK4930229.1 ubiquitin-protein ligase (E3) [Elasticomyces elasticus]KAK5761392.1 ubiquitin-protein ligase (E3) [Elasticomyces elasticus]
MYQTFSGSSRRPRQINLSGRPSNPFASAPGTSTTAPSAVATAAQDRLARQQQRDRVQASAKIQRTWRGHSARRRTFGVWRRVWDDLEEGGSKQSGRIVQVEGYGSEEESLRQLRRLMLFYTPKEDVRRLVWYGGRQVVTSSHPGTSCEGRQWTGAYLRVARACVAALRSSWSGVDDDTQRRLLDTLAFAARRSGEAFTAQDAVAYYEALTALKDAPSQSLQEALLAPLGSPQAYAGLAVLLARPLDPAMLNVLRSSINTTALCDALTQSPDQQPPRSHLWLLGNLVCLAGPARSTSPSYITAVARLLGSLAETVDFSSPPLDLSNSSFDIDVLAKVTTGLPLNTFLHEQITGLIDQNSIRNLLVRDSRSSGTTVGHDAQLLAGYALTLLRCFPRKADDIRMWLYLGPTHTSTDIGATRYFWSAARSTTVLQTISRNSRAVIGLLKSNQTARDDWTVILVFLELYTFLLKIMDDEEFMGTVDGKRSSAIPITDVAELVTFLKNLGFTLYFNAAELNGSSEDIGTAMYAGDTRGLGRHFGGGGMVEPGVKNMGDATAAKALTLAGLPGLTIDYLKGLVTGLLRAIYERDSRRHFLKGDHWLMTERFDMIAFIPGVVAEEESRHLVQDQEDQDGRDLDEDEEGEEGERFGGGGGGGGGYMAALRMQEHRERMQRKASRRRYLESVAPRLEILQNMPFFIPFTTRVEIFRQFVRLDQEKRRNGHVDPDLWRQSMMFAPHPSGQAGGMQMLARHHAKIRRKNEFRDAFEQFFPLGADLKEPIQITFVDEFDIAEAGIDGGGVTKEFLTSVITQAFDPVAKRGEEGGEPFFAETEGHWLHPAPTAVEDLKSRFRGMGLRDESPGVRAEVRELLKQFEFAGRVIGKCLYEGILVDVSFAGYFLKKWALTGGVGAAARESGYRANINDLKLLDGGLYRGLLALKNAPAEQVEDFGLTFVVDDLVGVEGHKEVIERELVPGGANMGVTAENRLFYINRMSWYRLQGQSASQTSAFLKGLGSIVQPSWMSMFNQSELQTLIGGASADIDVADLRRNTLYGGTYQIGDDGREHPSVALFWSVMGSIPDEERRKVLKFVTSTPRGPLLGFGQLNPRFSIRDSGQDEGRFPTTSTCVNLLKLPMYRSERVLREKLLAAVNSGAGFDLS